MGEEDLPEVVLPDLPEMLSFGNEGGQSEISDFNPKLFFRVSRGVLIAVSSIQKIHPHLNGRLKLDIAPKAPTEVFVSRERVSDFKMWLGS